ncbi:MAG: 30S ribosomal protein S13 [Candidatus Gracilibacteria bacterium]|jgi:small subunit ribosomal protein S13|nr:30S ribosomal protein S13 [Candidatus Gracilibacteria bacterium]
MSVRISGVTLPNKRIEVALTYVFGIGRNTSNEILARLKINKDKRANDLTETEVTKLREAIDKFPTEGNLRRAISMDIKRLMDIGCYKGYRHKRRLPVRGQRTKTNARTRKGKATPIANKKK